MRICCVWQHTYSIRTRLVWQLECVCSVWSVCSWSETCPCFAVGCSLFWPLLSHISLIVFHGPAERALPLDWWDPNQNHISLRKCLKKKKKKTHKDTFWLLSFPKHVHECAHIVDAHVLEIPFKHSSERKLVNGPFIFLKCDESWLKLRWVAFCSSLKGLKIQEISKKWVSFFFLSYQLRRTLISCVISNSGLNSLHSFRLWPL